MKKLLILLCFINFSCDLAGYKTRNSDIIYLGKWNLMYAIYQGRTLPKGGFNDKRTFIVNSDREGNFISTYSDSVLIFKEYIDYSKTKRKNNFIEFHLKNNTSVKVIVHKSKSNTELEISNFMKGEYSTRNDTIRYFYE